MLPVELLLLSTLATTSALGSAQHTFDSERNPRVLPIPETAQLALTKDGQDTKLRTYRCFGGHLKNYPSSDAWLSWDALWDLNREQILSSNGGNAYLQHYIMQAIVQVAEENNIDPRLLLVLIMQESNGNAAAPCQGSMPRCGIMHAPKGSHFDDSKPKESILDMIREGVEGSLRRGPGYADFFAGKPRLANVPVGSPYAAARAYKSGAVDANLDRVTWGQSSYVDGYVNDIANRLTGWNGQKKAFKKCI